MSNPGDASPSLIGASKEPGSACSTDNPILPRSPFALAKLEEPQLNTHPMALVDAFPPLTLIAAGSAHGGEVLTTLALALGAGAFLTVIAKKLRIPGIILLLLGGVLLGPEGIGIVQPEQLGPTLNILVSLAVGLILFEGGLTLNLAGYRTAGSVIRRLLSIGVIITWIGTAGAIYLLYDFDATFCLLAGSLVIVTGPTVIQPILKRTRLSWNLHQTLHWEGVLIDPIGVFLALLAFEWVIVGGGEAALLNLGLRVLSGLIIGIVGGELTCFLLKRKLISDEMLNIFMVGVAVMVFAATESFVAEGGLLGVTVAGLIIGSRQPPNLKSIVEFKSTIVDLLIGFIFILLTARLELIQFAEFGVQGFILVAIVICLVRPMAVSACTSGSELSMRERIFLGWFAPRGVVAASMASLFALRMQGNASGDPAFLEAFVYSVISVTVVLQGLSAGPLASLLKVRAKEPEGWLIVGAHLVGREVARFLRETRGVPVVLIDGNRRAVKEANAAGETAIFGDAREIDEILDRDEIQGIGRLLAFTDNEDLNELLCKKWEPTFGKGHVYRWSSNATSDQTATGTILWAWMPKPSMVSSELLLGEAAIVELEGERLDSPGGMAALLTATSKEVLIDPGPSTKLKGDKVEPRTIYLQREADYLLAALDAKWIFRSNAKSRHDLFKELAQTFTALNPDLDAADILARIIQRDEAVPSALGHGVALPHVRIENLEQPICAIAQIDPPLDFDAEDGEPVNLAFLLLSPIDQPELHLAILGEIARLMKVPAVRQQLQEARTPEDIQELIQAHRRLHTPFADVRF